MNEYYSFEIFENGNCQPGKIKYCPDVFIFDASEEISGGDDGIFGLYIRYTSLSFPVETKTAKWFSGYNDYQRWKPKQMEFPNSIKGELYIYNEIDNLDEKYIENWPTYYDKEKNILCIGDYNTNPNDRAVESCDNIVAVLEEKN